MKKKQNKYKVNEYKIQFIYTNNPDNIHIRYFQSINLEQVENNLSQIINDRREWKLISIEMYNNYSQKWELQE